MRPAWVDRELAFARVLGEELRARAWCYKPGTLGRHVGIEAAWRMAVQRDKEANACSPNGVTPAATIGGGPGDVASAPGPWPTPVSEERAMSKGTHSAEALP